MAKVCKRCHQEIEYLTPRPVHDYEGECIEVLSDRVSQQHKDLRDIKWKLTNLWESHNPNAKEAEDGN
jgi:hypothetical protein